MKWAHCVDEVSVPRVTVHAYFLQHDVELFIVQGFRIAYIVYALRFEFSVVPLHAEVSVEVES